MAPGAPMRRRHSSARAHLQQTSEIASILAANDEKPVNCITAEEAGCALPTTLGERKALISLQKFISRRGKPKGAENHDGAATESEKIKKVLTLFPALTRTIAPDVLPESKKKKKGKEKSSDKHTNTEQQKTHGNLLIHLAASKGCDAAVEILLDADPGCAEISCSSRGHTPLHIAASYGHLQMARAICSSSPKSARILDFEGNLPLHIALGPVSLKCATASLVASTLLASFPLGLETHNGAGLLPLHLAAKFGCSASMRALLACYVEACYVLSTGPDADGLIPLEFAITEYLGVVEKIQASGIRRKQKCQRDDEKSSKRNVLDSNTVEQKYQYEECIEMLLMSSLYGRPVFLPREECLEQGAGEDRNAAFFLPLHAAICCRLRKECWEKIISMYGARHSHDVNSEGQTTLHTLAAVSAETCDSRRECADDHFVQMITQLHKLNPKAFCYRDSNGCIPLHIAVLNGASAKIVQAFVDCGEEALSLRWE